MPVYSVDTEQEARDLLVLTCQRNMNNEFIASELVEDQTIDNLFAFGRRLAEVQEKWVKNRRANDGQH